MQSNNNNIEGAITLAVLGLVIVVLQFIATMILVGLVMVTTFMTLLALWAWNTPRQFCGEIITPEEARGFIGRGIIGAFVAFIAGQLYSVFAHVQISDNINALILLLGYAFASIYVGYLIAEEAEKKAEEYGTTTIEILPPQAPVPPSYAPPPFQFAEWDDEDERR